MKIQIYPTQSKEYLLAVFEPRLKT